MAQTRHAACAQYASVATMYILRHCFAPNAYNDRVCFTTRMIDELVSCIRTYIRMDVRERDKDITPDTFFLRI